MKWHDILSRALTRSEHTEDFSYNEGASRAQLARLESALGNVPGDLAELLRESNGIAWTDDDGERADWLVWPVEYVIARNKKVRREWGTAPGHHVYFADAGSDGILIGIDPESARIVAWSPHESEVGELAATLEEFAAGWVDGSNV